jgi:tetratricopeptide (TPR) repeat protein
MARRLLGDNKGAIIDLDEAIALNPASAHSYLQLAIAYAQEDDLQSALTTIDKSIELNPKDAIAFFERGEFRTALMLNQDAVDDYITCMKLGVREELFIRASLARSKLLAISGNTEQAIEELGVLAAMYPDDTRPVLGRAFTELNRGAVFRTFIDLVRTCWIVLSEKGSAEGNGLQQNEFYFAPDILNKRK